MRSAIFAASLANEIIEHHDRNADVVGRMRNVAEPIHQQVAAVTFTLMKAIDTDHGAAGMLSWLGRVRAYFAERPFVHSGGLLLKSGNPHASV